VPLAATAGDGSTSGDIARPSTVKKRHSDLAPKLNGERQTTDGFGYQQETHLMALDGGCLELDRDSGASSFTQGPVDRPDQDVGPYPHARGDRRRPCGYWPMALLPGGRKALTGGPRRREWSLTSGPLPILFHYTIKSPEIELTTEKINILE
jgi:hypothetical protein